jgi:regulator of protease activity HflC (stomatin/prohibitin superfamily)
MLGVLHQKVGPEYVSTVVIPEIESVLRILIGQLRAEEVYTTKHSIIEKALNSAVEQIAQRYITVDAVIIKRIVFPEAITKAIEEKMAQQQLFESYEFKLAREQREAERKRIEAQGVRDYNQTVAQSLSTNLLQWKWIHALEQSPNAKLIVSGAQNYGLPIVGNLPLDPIGMTPIIPTPTPIAEPSPPATPPEETSATPTAIPTTSTPIAGQP